MVFCSKCSLDIEKAKFINHLTEVHRVDEAKCPYCDKKYKISNYFRSHLNLCIKSTQNHQENANNTAQTIQLINSDEDNFPNIDGCSPEMNDDMQNMDFIRDMACIFYFFMHIYFNLR